MDWRRFTFCCVAATVLAAGVVAGCDDNGYGGTCGSYCQKAVVCATGSSSGISWCVSDCQQTIEANGPDCEASYELLAQCFQANSCDDIMAGTACGQEWMDMTAACPIEVCNEDETQCADGGCVPTDWVCDGMCDCNDCSDEDQCP